MNGSRKIWKNILIGIGAAVTILLLNIAFLIVRDSVYNSIVSAERNTSAAGAAMEPAAPPDAVTNVVAETTAAQELQPTAPPLPSPSVLPRILKADMINGSLTIETGLFFNVKFDPALIQVAHTGDVLSIRNAKNSFSVNERTRMDVTVTMPAGSSFDTVDVSLGAGKLTVLSMVTKELTLTLGAGNAVLTGLSVTESADIRCGAGAFSLKNSAVNPLTLQCGAGTTQIQAALTGESRVTAAMGEVDLALDGTENDYTLSFNLNLGACYYKGVRTSRSDTFGFGPNRVEISGGFGVVRVDVGLY